MSRPRFCHGPIKPTRPRRLGWIVFLAALGFCLPIPAAAPAAQRIWIGGNVNWIDDGSTASWNPADEPDADDEAIFNTANVVNLGSNNLIMALTMSGGTDLLTNDFDLDVDGSVQLAGTGTNLFIGGTAGLVDADDVTVNSGAVLELAGGLLNLDEESGTALLLTNAGGTVQGMGRINFADLPITATTLLNNNGTLSAFSRSGLLTAPPAGTLRIDGGFTGGRVDLDGSSETGVINVNRNQTLDLNVDFADSFHGTMNLFHNARFDSSSAWTLAGGSIFANNGFVDNSLPSPDIPADVSYIRGGTLTQTGGTISVVDTDGTLQIDADFNMSGGALQNNGTLILNGTTNLTTAGLSMPSSGSHLRVNGTTTMNAPTGTFNWDGPGAAGTATTTIAGNGSLALTVNQINTASDVFGGTINLLDDGDLAVNVTANSWLLAGRINKHGAGTSVVSGDRIHVQGAIDVTAGILELPATTLGSAADVHVIGELRLGNGTIFDGPELSGPGSVRFEGTTTFSANTTLNIATMDWDGTSNGTLQTIEDGVSLTINSTTIDADGNMGDPLNLGGNGAALVVNGPTNWSHTGVLTTNTSSLGQATIGGTSRINVRGELNVQGHTEITAPVQFGSGSTTTIEQNTELAVQNSALYNGGTITGPGRFQPSFTDNTVTADSTIRSAFFNFGQGDWTVQPGVQFTVDVVDYGNAFNRTMTLNNGGVVVLTDDDRFVMDGTLNMNASQGQRPFWTGQAVDIGNDVGVHDAVINVTGDGNSEAQFGSLVKFKSDANVHVPAGAILQFTSSSPVVFDTLNGPSQARIQGAGAIRFDAAVTVNEAVTLDMAGGRVDLDGFDSTGDLILVNAPFTINATTLEDFGRVNGIGGNNTLEVNSSTGTGSLIVNLDDPTAEWTLNAASVLILKDNVATGTLIDGNDVNVNGTVHVVSQNPNIGARVDFGATAVVNVNLGARLTLSGGSNSTATSNTINGGVINGPGILNASPGKGLVGFGTINAPIDFDGGVSDLEADNGMLTVQGAILDVAKIGPIDADGILNVPSDWNSSTADIVRLQGGEFRGGTITVDNELGVRGFGLMRSRLINNTQIVAEGGTLIVNTANNENDWDGNSGNGLLMSDDGDVLELRDNASFPFTGTVRVDPGAQVFANGFGLEFEPGSRLELTGGTYEATSGMNIGGTVLVGAGTDSSLKRAAGITPITFEATSTTTLNGNLQLNSQIAEVESGATFHGLGALVVTEANSLIPAPNANIGALLDVRGQLFVADNGISRGVGRLDLRDYQQSENGRLLVDLAGTNLNEFDRLVINGTALIDGRLHINLDAGYSPSLGDEYPIILATGGLLGTFNDVLRPAGIPLELRLEPIYGATSVILKALPSGDFNGDQNFDCADVDSLVAQIAGGGGGSGFDMNGDGSVNSADLPVWLAEAGAANLASGNPYLSGDANLDGVVDGQDFISWNANKFTSVAAWCRGDFNADSVVDGQDFIIWNANKFAQVALGIAASGTSMQTVPEPTGILLYGIGWLILAARRPRT